jgi:hypothetical protein
LFFFFVELGGDLGAFFVGFLDLLQFGEMIFGLALFGEAEEVLSSLSDIFPEHC